MNKHFGNYLGIVVNTIDPEKRGRVQVFVPNITPTLYKDWNETAKNKSFKTFDSKNFSEKVKERLQTHLPWAEAAVPFWGGSTGAPINQSYGTPTPMPTDQNFDYQGTSNPIPGVLAQTGNTGRVFGSAGGYHLDVRWGGDKYGDQITTADIDKYILVDGKSPSSYEITSEYGDQESFRSSPHKGIDFATPGGSNIQLINGATYGSSGWDDGGGGYVVSINLPDGTSMSLLHLQEGSINPDYGKEAADVPTEAYADTREFEKDALASPLGDVNGDTGTIGSTSDILSEIRSIYGQDLANQETLNTIYGLIKSEVGTQSDATQLAFVETLFNRSYVQGDSLTDTVSNQNYFGVYGNGSYAQARQNLTQSDISKYNSLIQEALNGSNVSNGSAHAGQYGDPGIDPDGIYEAIDSTKVEIDGEVFYNKTSQLDKLGVLADVSGDASLITNGQNVVRTRTPDSYGSLTGPRTGGTMGFNSVPHVGSKVWLFFMGGDVQKPVYFATIYEPNNIA